MECPKCGGDEFRCACCEDMVDVAPEQAKWQRIGYLKGIDALEKALTGSITQASWMREVAKRLREEVPDVRPE